MNKVTPKQQLQGELTKLRQRVADLEAQESKRKQAEEALKESEQRYIHAEKLGQFGHWRRDFRDEEATWSVGAYRIFGVEPDQFKPIQENVLNLVHPDDKEALRRTRDDASLKGRGFDIEFRIIRPDGEERVLHSVADVYTDSDGKPMGFFGTMVDVTERKRADEALHLRAHLLNEATDSIIATDLDGNLIYMNEATCLTYGYSKEQLLNMNLRQLVSPDIARLVGERLRHLKEEGVITFESEHRRRDGSVFPVEVAARTVNLGDKTIILSVIRDITEQKKAEEDIKKFKVIADNAAYGVSIGDMEGRLIYANESYARMHGYTIDELIGKDLFTLYPDDQHEFMMKRIARIKETGSAIGELIRKRKDGTIFPTLSTATLVKDDEGRSLYIASSHFDLTERRKAEEALEISEEKFSRAFHSNPYPMSIVTMEGGRYLDVNDSYMQTFGFSREELLGRTTVEMGIAKTGRFRSRLLQRLKKAQEVKNLETEFYTRSGRKVNALFSADKIEIGGETCLLSVINDVTERKMAEEALKESEERYRALLELGERIGEAVVMLQDDERGVAMHVYVSDEWARITGYSREELLNMSMAELIHPRDRTEATKRYEKRIRGEVLPGLYEITIVRKDGSEVPVEVTYAYSSYKGKPVNVGYIRDITERKKMEEQLIVTDRLASIGELASGVAHELNNPLTGIIGFSELLLNKDVPEDVRGDLKIINREAQRTAQVVRNLLTFARKHDTTKKPADINKAIKSVLDLRAYEQKVHNIEVVTNFDPELPEITADIFRLQQVFVNIIINAEYFIEQAHGRGTITITTKVKGDTILASFADDGPGIKKEHLRHLFDPFFTTKEVGQGTGLGLSICHGIVTEHGGRIYAESKPGQGTTFIVELPVR